MHLLKILILLFIVVFVITILSVFGIITVALWKIGGSLGIIIFLILICITIISD